MKFRDVGEAARALEATMVKELLKSSGAFRGTSTAGSSLNADLFMDVLADAVTKGDGLGIGSMVAKSLSPRTPDGAKGTEDAGRDGLGRHGPDGLPVRSPDLNSLCPQGGLPLDKLPPGFGPRGPAAQPHSQGTHQDHPPEAREMSPTLSPHVLPGMSGRPAVSSNFGQRIHPIDGTSHFHTGMDLRAAQGTPILAAAPGVVRRSGERGGYGNAVEIDHGNGVSTLYAHASALAVSEGQQIAAGQELGSVGDTGKATGAHLHFEVRVNGKPVDPRRALNAYGVRAEAPSEEGPNQPSKAR
jgi:murein DD-endopeptidase MepM/ murein hydrolase activator NlpD